MSIFVNVMILSIVTFNLGWLMRLNGVVDYERVFFGGLAFGVLGIVLALKEIFDKPDVEDKPINWLKHE